MNVNASEACVVCWGQTSQVLLTQYIEQLRSSSAELERYFPSQIEVVVNADFMVGKRKIQCVEPMFKLPVLASVLRVSMLEAFASCDIQIDGEVVPVPCESWKYFNVSDAGMNYEQALQINTTSDIVKIHDDAQMQDNCWVHRHEVVKAKRMPLSEIRCLACAKKFDKTTVSLLYEYAEQPIISKIYQNVHEEKWSDSLLLVQTLSVPFLVTNDKIFWKLMLDSVKFKNMEIFDYLLENIPHSKSCLKYDRVIYELILRKQYPIELDRLDEILNMGGVFTSGYFDRMELLCGIIENCSRNPILLFKKLRLVFDHSKKLQLSHRMNIGSMFSTYADRSILFSEQHFLEGCNLVFKIAHYFDPDFEIAPSLGNSFVLKAALRNDARLLKFWTETNNLDINCCDINSKNAYFYTSSAATIEYLYMRGVNVHLILPDGSTPITHLLEKVLVTDFTRNDNIVCECVALLYSYGVQSYTDIINCRPNTQIDALEDFHNEPLRLAEMIMEKYGSHQNLVAMIRSISREYVLPTWVDELFLSKTGK